MPSTVAHCVRLLRSLTIPRAIPAFVTIMAVEIFGSPFMRNCSCVIGLLWGYAASTWSRHHGEQYVTQDLMKASPGITFLWGGVKGHGGASTALDGFFPISFHPPLISASSLR